MSLLQMFACEGCAATAEPWVGMSGSPYAPEDWLVITGPATDDEIKSHTNRVLRHVCSPACLVTLAERLAALPDALQPVEAT